MDDLDLDKLARGECPVCGHHDCSWECRCECAKEGAALVPALAIELRALRKVREAAEKIRFHVRHGPIGVLRDPCGATVRGDGVCACGAEDAANALVDALDAARKAGG